MLTIQNTSQKVCIDVVKIKLRTIWEIGGSKINVGYVLFHKHETLRRPTNRYFYRRSLLIYDLLIVQTCLGHTV